MITCNNKLDSMFNFSQFLTYSVKFMKPVAPSIDCKWNITHTIFYLQSIDGATALGFRVKIRSRF